MVAVICVMTSVNDHCLRNCLSVVFIFEVARGLVPVSKLEGLAPVRSRDWRRKG